MKASAFIRIITALALVFGLTGCTKTWIWHQKVTVTVETPEGDKTASSVLSYVLDGLAGVAPNTQRLAV